MIILFHIFIVLFIVSSFVACIKRAFTMGQEYERKRIIDETNGGNQNGSDS